MKKIMMCKRNLVTAILIGLTLMLQLFTASPAYADQFHSITMEFGADRGGADYKSIEMTSNDPLGCQVLCAQDSACKAYTFVPAGILTFEQRGPIPRCYLKNNAQPQSVYKGLISGKKLP
ncbi:MAG: hypothetical protein F6K63_15645 [Moorea sp. SIO1G6]|uniref:PAN domain-containing protein n=1 Tax=Moorena sp. SIO1G6 TaxID=2607840 RepID=UPI0013BFB8B0|nr:PAN domain-containing protein [Moorena sp. SIO1G6]NET65742.1 hypothetical protein [Moorena sp. SIO1G6]